jgi:hypothetical protein
VSAYSAGGKLSGIGTESVTVSAGAVVPVTVEINRINTDTQEKGSLAYTFIYPGTDDRYSSRQISLFKDNVILPGSPVTLADRSSEKSSGTLENLDPGTYSVVVIFEQSADAVRAVWTTAAHIYGGAVTPVTHTFTAGEFESLIPLYGTVRITLPGPLQTGTITGRFLQAYRDPACAVEITGASTTLIEGNNNFDLYIPASERTVYVRPRLITNTGKTIPGKISGPYTIAANQDMAVDIGVLDDNTFYSITLGSGTSANGTVKTLPEGIPAALAGTEIPLAAVPNTGYALLGDVLQYSDDQGYYDIDVLPYKLTLNGDTTVFASFVSTNANLGALRASEFSGGALTLSPGFSGAVEEYAAEASSTAGTITVTGTPVVSASTVSYRIDGDPEETVGYGGDQPINDLLPGESRKVYITVRAAYGNEKVYTLTITKRLAAPAVTVTADPTHGEKLNVAWNAINGATGYELAQSSTTTRPSEGTPYPASPALITVSPGQTYLWVRAKNDTVTGDWSPMAIGTPMGNDVSLSGLFIDGADLSPVFAVDTSEYTAVLPADHTSGVIVGADPTDSNAMAFYNFDGGPTWSNSPSPKAIAYGAVALVRVRVTAHNGVTKTDPPYSITVTRRLPAPANFAVNHTAVSGQLALSWNTVSGTPTGYEVWYNTTGTLPTGDDAVDADYGDWIDNNTITGTSALIAGLNNGVSYHFWVRAKKAVTNPVSLTIYGEYSQEITGVPRSGNVSLSSLTVKGALAPPDSADGTAYTVQLTYSGSDNIQVIGTAADGGFVTYKIGGEPDGAYGSANTLTTLTEGSSAKVYVRVSAANGFDSAIYTVTVSRTKPIGIVVNLPGTEAVTLNIGGTNHTGSEDNPQISWASPGSLTFTVSGGYDSGSLQWLVDSADKTSLATGNSLTIQARSWTPKTYNLTVKVQKDGVLYSAAAQFTVTQ